MTRFLRRCSLPFGRLFFYTRKESFVVIFKIMILSVVRSVITEPKFLDIEILAEESTIDADARIAILKVIEFATLTLDEDPTDRLFAQIQTKLIAAGYLCTYHKTKEPLKLRVQMTPTLESSFVSGPSLVTDVIEGRVKINHALNDSLQRFIQSRVFTQNIGEN